MDALPLAASALDLARWQFAGTTLYHFTFVPLTLGLAPLVAVMQTLWYRTGNDQWLRLTKFFGTLLIINFAIGAATGLLQEFQFGMNWSAYSAFVGDVFGSTLALEGLAAFMLESTFIGLWVFGWNRLSPKMHLATIWLVAGGTWLSTTFILMANSWMQNPVGYSIDPATGQARMENLWSVVSNPIAIWAVAHTLLMGLMTGAFLLLGVACWHILRSRNAALFRPVVKLALIVAIPATALNLAVGSGFGVALYEGPQPMKIAAAEALWNSEKPASFSIFQVGGFTEADQTPSFTIEIPYLLSFLATNNPTSEVKGMLQIQDEQRSRLGPGNYLPNIYLTYWGMRGMAYIGTLSMLVALLGGFLYWRGKLEGSRWFLRLGVVAIAFPFVSALIGWVFTEAGRQPWIVYEVMRTEDGVSPSVSAAEVAASLSIFIGLYTVLAITAFVLLRRYARVDPPDAAPAEENDRPIAVAGL
ncbi:MAG: cytochrome ubiquinol oxidase subunit I [Solirubrobacterales bacterium]